MLRCFQKTRCSISSVAANSSKQRCKIRCLSTTASSSSSTGTKTTSSSVSQQEISKFSGMNQDWWDPSFHPLIAMNPIRIRYILEQVKKQQQNQTQPLSNTAQHNPPPPLHNLKALDIGCGGGLLSESLARLGANVTAIDPSQALVDIAQEHALQTGDPRLQKIDYRGGLSVEDLAASTLKQDNNKNNTDDDDLFDIVCLLEVLEHASDVSSLVNAATSLVKPTGGLLFVSTMNRTWKSHLLTIVGAEYIMGYVPRGTHDWDQYLAPEEVAQIMDGFGMQQVNVNGMVLNKPPLCGEWDWRLDANDTDVNWIGAYRRRPEKLD